MPALKRTQKTDPPEIIEARAAQLAAHSDAAEALCARMRRGGEVIQDWGFVPVEDADWETWPAAMKWFAIERRYRWECLREASLKLGGGPFYAACCGEKRPAEGWKPGKCIEHEWADWLMEDAIAAAYGVFDGDPVPADMPVPVQRPWPQKKAS